MIKLQIKYLLVCSLLIALTSCSSSEEDERPTLIVGQDFTETNIRVLSIDTFRVELSTMKFDSIPTSGLNRLLVGKYEDDFMGTVSASTYFRVSGSSYLLDDDAVLDSVGIVIGYDSYFYNDTTQISTITVHKLLEDLETDEASFYNTSQIPYEVAPLGSIEFYPEPNRDSLYIPLPLDFGEDLFNDIRDNEITDNESLYQRLKGFTLQPSTTDNGSIIGYTPDQARTYLRFFYTIPEEFEEEERNFDLSINGFSLSYFNNISSDVSGLELDNIDDQEVSLLSTETNNLSYLQSGVGYAARIDFPTIKKLQELEGEGTVLDAILEIKPNNAAYSDTQTIPELLSLYLVDQNNDLTTQVANSEDFVFGTFTQNDAEFNNAIYRVPVIDFVDKKLNELPETEDTLILIPAEYNSSVNKILFNDGFNADFKARLIITYAIYAE